MAHARLPGPLCAVFVVAALCLTSAAAKAGVVLHVDDDAAAGGDGQSWQTAYRFLQDALAEAAALPGTVSQIRVAQGTYRPDRSEAEPQGSGVRSSTFALVDGVELRGGFLGLSADIGQDPDSRNPALYPAVLSGDLAGNDGPDFQNNGENAYRVVRSAGNLDTAILDGFTIRRGNGNGSSLFNGGGGLRIDGGGSPTVRTCTFEDNFGLVGGAVLVSSGTPTFTGCAFSANQGQSGGGLFINAGGVEASGCVFLDNVANAFGGGVFKQTGTSTFSECAFEGNAAGSSGGGAYLSASVAAPGGGDGTTLGDCSFIDNTADGDGGGAYTSGGTPSFQACQLLDNTATNGAGLYALSGGLQLTDCTLAGNAASIDGGGIFTFNSSVALEQCMLLGNSAEVRGGGLMHFVQSGLPPVLCPVSSLMPPGEGTVAGGELSVASLSACVVEANSACIGGAAFNHGVLVIEEGLIHENQAPLAAGIYSLGVARGTGAPGGEGMINLGSLEPGDAQQTAIYRLGGTLVHDDPSAPLDRPGRTLLRIAGPAAGAGHDAVETDGTLAGRGTLELVLSDGFEPAVDQAPLAMATYAALADPYSLAMVPAFGDGLYLEVDYTADGAGTMTATVRPFRDIIAFAGSPAGTVAGTPVASVTGALDADGGEDVALVLADPPGLVVLPNAGTDALNQWLGFMAAIDLGALVGDDPRDVVAADLDGDGLDELAVACGKSGHVAILSNRGGAFEAALVDVGAMAMALHEADLDDDGDVDLVVANGEAGTVTLLVNDGGSLAAGAALSAGLEPVDVRGADATGDGHVDLIVLTREPPAGTGASVALLAGSGAGAFQAPIFHAAGTPGSALEAADLDRDGAADALVIHADAPLLDILPGASAGFAGAVQQPLPEGALSLAAADLDGDGDIDLALTLVDAPTPEESLVVLENLIDDGRQLALHAVAGLAPGSDSRLVIAGDVNPDPLEDLVALNVTAPGQTAAAGLLNTACPADLGGDARVDRLDLQALLEHWGAGDIQVDVNGDGVVDILDLIEIVVNWGPCPSLPGEQAARAGLPLVSPAHPW